MRKDQTPGYVFARQRRQITAESLRAEQSNLLREHQPLARIAFIALIGMLLYMSTVAYNTTHLDLLLNCSIPDDCIDYRRYPLFMARSVMRELIEQLKAQPQGVRLP